MLHDVGNNRDCDVDVDHRNNTKLNRQLAHVEMTIFSHLRSTFYHIISYNIIYHIIS